MRNKNHFPSEAANPDCFDFLIVGAGPSGLACALELTSLQQVTVTIDKGCIADSIYRFPDGMRFFSGGRSLEFGGIPMASEGDRPTRIEAIRYYRDVVRSTGLDVRQRETVLSIDGQKGDFQVRTSNAIHRTRRIVIATGFYGEPNLIGAPGESLHKVAHYYRDAHPYFGQNVAVVGGRNSAGIVASELAEAGAKVTLIHYRDGFGMKPWIAENLQTQIDRGAIRALMGSRVSAIKEGAVLVETLSGQIAIPNDFVFAMTGYRPDFEFLKRNGLPLAPCGTRPLCNPDTLESGRAGIYYAGTVMAGLNTHEISIETARHHGKKIVEGLFAESACVRRNSEIREVSDHARPNP